MEEIYIFGHKCPDTDSVCSAIVKKRLEEKKRNANCKAFRLGEINKETEYVLNNLGIECPELLEKVEENQKVILVDHNEFPQSVEEIEKALILEVVDHHRISNFVTVNPLYYTARPYGCTSTILYRDFIANGIEISREDAILMASAIISDTLLLKSPTATEFDKEALEELCKIAGIDKGEYGIAMLKAGTNLDDFTEKELVCLDAKQFEKDGVKCVIAQVNTVSIEDTLKREDGLKKAIADEIEEKNLDLFVLAITDILNSNSEIIAMGNRKDIIEKTHPLNNDRVFLEGVVSRKKQLLPLVENNI